MGDRARVRCSECGSTRVKGITLGYREGRLDVDDDGRVFVAPGCDEVHDEYAVESGSVVCANCGSGRYRVEQTRSTVDV